MKKTYISPEFIAVELRCSKVIAFSMDMTGGEGNQIQNESDVLVKENYPPISDKNVWDDEW